MLARPSSSEVALHAAAGPPDRGGAAREHATMIASSSRRRAAAVVASLVAVASGVACGGGGGGGTAPPQSTTITIQVTSGSALQGVSLDLNHSAASSVTAVGHAGVLGTATCVENPEPGRLRVACVTATPVSAPFGAWQVTFAHAGDDPGVLSLTCTGSDAAGTVRAIDCLVE